MHAALIACPRCDLLQRTTPLTGHADAHCKRCFTALYGRSDTNVDRPLAYTLAAAILFLLANVFPIVGLEVQGQGATATLFGTAQALHAQHMTMLAALVFVTTIVVPGVQLAAMLYVLVPLKLDRVPHWMPMALRVLQAVRPWGMVEVFILAMLVSLVKLAGMATVVPGAGMWSFGGLLLMISAAVASFDARSIWARLDPRRGWPGGAGATFARPVRGAAAPPGHPR
jgi:paraquat-inducible protein A